MLKKIISLLLAICMLFCFAACGKTETNNSQIDDSSNSQMDELPSTDESDSSTDKTESSADKTETTQSNNSQESSNTAQPEKPDPVQPIPPVTKPTHTHKYADANCTAPKTCSCGATQGTALGHEFSSATCTAPKICSRCGKTEGNSSAHNYKDGICSACDAVDEQKYVDAQIEVANKAFKDYTKYNDALKVIKAALQKFPQNSQLKTKRDYYQSFEPVSLCDLKPYKKSYAYISNGSSSDNFENQYEKCVYKPYYNPSASATYDLAYKYNSFKATVFMRCDCTGQTYGTIKIYGDGSLLYDKTGIDVYGRPFNIEVDVTGVQDLEIVIESGSGAFIFGLGNCVLQRTSK